MEVYRKPAVLSLDGTEDKRKVRYKNQAQIDEKYAGVQGCRYRVNRCYESAHYGKCCHTCSLESTCKWACLSTVEDCQSVF